MGLVKTLFFLFFLIISTSGIQAEENEERRTQLNGTQTPLYGDDSVIEALTVQNNNVYNTGPNDTSIYGSITKVETDIYDSPDSPQPSSSQIRTVVAPGGPGHQGVTYARSKGHNHKGPPNQRTVINYGSRTYQSGNTYKIDPRTKNVFGSITVLKNNVLDGGENHTQSNGSDNRYGSITVQLNNHYQTSAGANNHLGSRLHQEGNVFPDTEKQTDGMDKLRKYIPKSQSHFLESALNDKAGKPLGITDYEVNSQGEEKAENNTESQDHSAEGNVSDSQASLPSSLINFSPNAQKGEKTQNNTESQDHSAEGNVSDSQASLPSSLINFSPNAQKGEIAQNNTESQDHSAEDNASGSRASSPSSSNNFSPNTQNGEKAQNNTESQANLSIPNSANKKLSLFFDKLIIYFLIVLPSYYLF